ncbi:hypothetical protein PGT21_002804 [Puccinia graminis f. sp. tritici]|uniref:Uncharacterized protein n=1 Tax=Puccinia graminis f. sp. tritici TaxID=56615 RepID=A0A5B0LK28_PUCGR|nr:hypothetical protein PGT21_002804 [Puccinia graminis f. sp. tritici]
MSTTTQQPWQSQADAGVKLVGDSLTVDREAGYVPLHKWMSNIDIGPLLANWYNTPVVFVSTTGSMTYLPTTKCPGNQPTWPIFLGFINGNHWILLHLKRGLIPYPPV